MSEVSNRRFVHFDGTKDEFIDGGYPDTYNESIVFINGDGNEGNNTIYTHGEYYGQGGVMIKGTGKNSIISKDSRNIASASYSMATGYSCEASSSGAHAEGYSSTASGGSSHSEGYETTASGAYSHAEGYMTEATYEGAHAEGYMTDAKSQYGHAEGVLSISSKSGAHAEGGYLQNGTYYKGGTASGYGSHAEGVGTIASGNYSHAEGKDSSASALGAHAEGKAQASGKYSHAENSSYASGENSHAEGNSSYASGANSHAGGFNCYARGTDSFAMGRYCDASVNNTVAMGYHSTAKGQYSMSLGYYTNTSNKSEFACGSYNKTTEGKTLFSVGCGKYDDNKNAIEVTTDGEVYIHNVDYPLQNTVQCISLTYDEFVSLLNDSKLRIGWWYRITDYVTDAYGCGIKSAKHPFDVIVRANSESSVDPEGYCCRNKNDDGYFNHCSLDKWKIWYDPFGEREWTGKKTYIKVRQSELGNYYEIDHEMVYVSTNETKIIDGVECVKYFHYDMYNKTIGDGWQYDGYVYLYVNIENEIIYASWNSSGSGEFPISFGAITTIYNMTHKGLIYRMIDEYGNDCPYDFKNIMFERLCYSSIQCTDNINLELISSKYISSPYYNLLKYVSQDDYNNAIFLYAVVWDYYGNLVRFICDESNDSYVYTFSKDTTGDDTIKDNVQSKNNTIKYDNNVLHDIIIYGSNNNVMNSTNITINGNNKKINNCNHIIIEGFEEQENIIEHTNDAILYNTKHVINSSSILSINNSSILYKLSSLIENSYYVVNYGKDNIIKNFSFEESYPDSKRAIHGNCNELIGCDEIDIGEHSEYNKLTNCFSITIGEHSDNNELTDCYNINIHDDCYHNIFNKYCKCLTLYEGSTYNNFNDNTFNLTIEPPEAIYRCNINDTMSGGCLYIPDYSDVYKINNVNIDTLPSSSIETIDVSVNFKYIGVNDATDVTMSSDSYYDLSDDIVLFYREKSKEDGNFKIIRGSGTFLKSYADYDFYVSTINYFDDKTKIRDSEDLDKRYLTNKLMEPGGCKTYVLTFSHVVS